MTELGLHLLFEDREAGGGSRSVSLFLPWQTVRGIRLGIPAPAEYPPPAEEGELPSAPQVAGEAEDPIPGWLSGVRTTERNRPNATTLDRVVPIVQKKSTDNLTVALVSLEVHEGGEGVLRYALAGRHEPRLHLETPEKGAIRVCKVDGESLPSFAGGGSAWDGGAEGEINLRDVPGGGTIEVEISHVETAGSLIGGNQGEEERSRWDGPWKFRFEVG